MWKRVHVLYRIFYYIWEFRKEFNKFYIIFQFSLIVFRSYFFLLYFNEHYQVRNIFSIKSIMKNIRIYRSSYLSPFFLNFHQSFRCRAVDWSRDSDGCYCVWTAPAWLIDWSVNGNDSTEFYAVQDQKDGRFRFELAAGTMHLLKCHLWKMKNWRLDGIGNSVSIIQNLEKNNLILYALLNVRIYIRVKNPKYIFF